MRIEKYKEDHSVKKCHQKQQLLEAIALLSNGKTSAHQTYETFTTRNEIKIHFDACKNTLYQ